MDKLKHLKKIMDDYLKDAADFELDDNFSPGSKLERFYHYGYGRALRDVLKSFHLTEKADIEEHKKDIVEIIDRVKKEFPSAIVSLDTVSNIVPDFMASLEMDVFNVPKEKYMDFENLADDLAFKFFNKTNLTIILLAHNEEDTKRYYPEIISGK